MRNKITWLFLGIVIVFGFVFFYFYFPQVWGELTHPLDYKESIKKYAKQRDLKPNLVAGLIYTESRFNSGSVSGAGAIGLMQIMPGTASSIAKEMEETNFSINDLSDPDTNIKFGTWYFKGLLDKFDGDLDTALASYNAGVPRAENWKNFNTALPYETVNFISAVKNAEAEYEKIYGNWYDQPEVKKPEPFYSKINNFVDFVKDLILGRQ